jgi:hypothetical protein
MLIAVLILLCLALAAGVYFAKRRREKFDAEQTARTRAARRRWSNWLDGEKPEPPHDETYVEYQERKRR